MSPARVARRGSRGGTVRKIRLAPWSPPRPGRARLFEDRRLELLTIVPPWLPHVIFLPCAALLFWKGGSPGVSPSLVIVLVVAGIGLWTLTEYAIHRHVFHFRAARPSSRVLAYLVHGVHHAYPSDPRRLVMPPVVSVPLSLPIHLGFSAVLGPQAGAICFSGFLLGYLWYDTTHYWIHARSPRWKWMAALKNNHLRHHFQEPARRFGVTSTLWDHVFGTR